jgi:hypothetical protein
VASNDAWQRWRADVLEPALDAEEPVEPGDGAAEN